MVYSQRGFHLSPWMQDHGWKKGSTWRVRKKGKEGPCSCKSDPPPFETPSKADEAWPVRGCYSPLCFGKSNNNRTLILTSMPHRDKWKIIKNNVSDNINDEFCAAKWEVFISSSISLCGWLLICCNWCLTKWTLWCSWELSGEYLSNLGRMQSDLMPHVTRPAWNVKPCTGIEGWGGQVMAGIKRIVCATVHPVPRTVRTQTILPFILQQSGIFGKMGSVNFLAFDYNFLSFFFFLINLWYTP